MVGVAGPIALITLASLATCCPRPGRAPPPSRPTPCHSERLDRMMIMGLQRSPELKERIKTSVGDIPIRWIAPGDAVTEDYSETRLNIYLTDKGEVQSYRCG